MARIELALMKVMGSRTARAPIRSARRPMRGPTIAPQSVYIEDAMPANKKESLTVEIRKTSATVFIATGIRPIIPNPKVGRA